MKPTILLDSHVFIWLSEDDDQLGKLSRQIVLDNAQPLAVSYFSLLELTFKTGSGKFKNFIPQAKTFLQKMNIELLVPNWSVLEQYQVFSPSNKDPFDNLLIATALENNYAFMTADHKILATKLRKPKIIDATK